MAVSQCLSGKKKNHRAILTTSHLLRWPKINDKSEEIVINEINKIFADCPDLKLKSKKPKKKFTADNCNSETKDKRFNLLLGINAVTRALEKDEVAAVIISNTATPSCLVEHLIHLSTSRRVPIIGLKHLSTKVADIIGITCLTAFGIKKAALSKPTFTNLLNVICGLSKTTEMKNELETKKIVGFKSNNNLCTLHTDVNNCDQNICEDKSVEPMQTELSFIPINGSKNIDKQLNFISNDLPVEVLNLTFKITFPDTVLEKDLSESILSEDESLQTSVNEKCHMNISPMFTNILLPSIIKHSLSSSKKLTKRRKNKLKNKKST